ncbi:aldo/keto reductase [Marispirochaeta sp.]|uniref:aldo/keto reductase n=1 Tax=Marispirochaeta sp. TaxID=2038653 RepID=UPI0029C94BC2|nr:aldo/keto reductase [Marispirochaeta sp.]
MNTSPLIGELNTTPSPGLGCAAFGGTHWGVQDDRDSMAALATAIEAGVRHIDTAAAYGSGRSETLIGNLIRRRPSVRDGLLIASKGGIKGSKKNFLKEIDNSRRRLGCEVIDIYYIHWPMEGVDPIPSLEALAEAKEKHTIRYVGVSNFTSRQLTLAHGNLPLDACQFGYNLIWRHPDTGIIPLCGQLGIARIAYGALAQGLLSGNYQPWSRFPEGDDRDHTAFFSDDHAVELTAGLSTLKALCAQYHVPLRSAALHWISSREYLEGSLAGARTAEQAKENFQLQRIDSELLDKLHVAGKEISTCFGNTENFFRMQ